MNQKEKYQKALKLTANDLGLSEELVNKVYQEYWRQIKLYIQQLPLKEELTFEQFSQLQTSVNIPSLGKLACIYDKYIKKCSHYKQTRNYGSNKES